MGGVTGFGAGVGLRDTAVLCGTMEVLEGWGWDLKQRTESCFLGKSEGAVTMAQKSLRLTCRSSSGVEMGKTRQV